LEIYLAFQQWKNFENPLRIDKVIAMSSVCSFFGPPCMSDVDHVRLRMKIKLLKNSQRFILNL